MVYQMFSYKFFLRCICILFINFITLTAIAKEVVVIVPLEHEAMKQIVNGIEESIGKNNAEIVVKNAHGDPNIMLSIVKQIKDSNADIVMPIGTSTSHMAISHITNKPIICVAADLAHSKSDMVTGVNDEISITELLSKLQTLRKIAVIYSANEKIMPEVEELKIFTKIKKIDLSLSMIQSLADLPLVLKNLPTDIQAFFILKDHLVVSGINAIIQEAYLRNIPVIASDEGSVKNGATIAFGVQEKEIGIKSGLMAKEILSGKNPNDIPYQTLHAMSLFINTQSFNQQQTLTKDTISALKLHIVEFDS